ncbi:DUF2470 domain-containing protein [Micromonospora sp. RHAY321]|uniref:DUF2470 domain-containing protein n=1 Tax=Micromonospora sp. RHAY321 TaxID=2944807 RepID=UPI00207D05D5|nr:DUF2470 domain-containing protein [Micromonospora sp. RHAY321]MCO1597025.1 DUF2470 domain-containing protein [Micromonospora sp. RHAY321]
MLVAAQSLGLRTPGYRADIAGRHSVTGDGRVRVELPAGSHMARDIAHQRETVAMIEVTDLAPTPVRDRVRARGTLTGWLSPASIDRDAEEGQLVTVLDLATAELSTTEGTTTIDPIDFVTARPDPLAATEAELLCHLDHHHPHTVERLCRLVDPHRLHGVRMVRPLRLDRHGLVLRLELVNGDRDIRLRFPAPVRHPDQLGAQIEALLRQARRCRPPRAR